MAKLIAANYNSTTSTAYGFMGVNIPAGVIKRNTVYTLVARYKWTKGSVDDHPAVAYLYDSGWTNIAGYYNITYTNDTYAVQTKVFTIPDKDEIATTSFKIHNYACTSGNTDKGAVLAVDWYELWEGDVTQFSLKDAIGLSGAGVNLYSGLGGNDYSNLLKSGSGFTNHGVDITTFGFPCQKITTSTDTGYCYKSESGVGSGYYNLSYDLYSTVEVTNLSSYASEQGHILLSQTTYVPAKTWTRVYCTYQATNSNMMALCSPQKAGTYYIKDLKIVRCDLECPINYTDASATSNTLPNNFNSIISNVRNSNYFNNTNTDGINSVRNWRGYYYNTNTFIASTSLSTTSVAASGGSITVNYTVKENWTNGKTPTPKAGVTPTITSSIGTVSNITATDANGNGTAKITVASRGTTVGAAQTGTVSVSFGGVTRTATFTQALNKITSVRIAGSIPSGGAYTNPPSLNNQAPASGKTWSPFTIYPTFSSGAAQGNYSSAIAQSNWSISGEGFSVAARYNGWWAVEVTAASRGTTIGSARTGTLTVTIPDGVGGTVSGSTSLSQEANAKTSITYGNPVISTFSYANKNAATGTVSPSISYYQTRVQNYTSGSEETLSNLTSGGTISYSETTASSYASVNASTGVVTWNANTGMADRSVGITATVTMNGKSVSKAATSKQTGDEVVIIEYGPVTAGTITNATIPASGTTTNYKATAGNGSQVITKSWVSGDTTTETNTISPTVASISATASSKGTTISNITTIKSQAVAWNGSGNKSASGTMYIYQAGNYVTEITPKADTANVNHFYYATKAAAAGGSVSPTNNGTATYKFSSGSTGTYSASNVPTGVTWTFSRTYSGSATGATLNASTGAVTWANNISTSERSINVTSVLTVTCAHNSTYSAGGTLIKTLSHTSTCSQNKGSVEYIITPSVTSMGALAAAGQSKTSTITYTTKWNGITTATGTALSGYTITENTDTLTKVSASGTSGTVTVASSNNTSTSSGTFKYTISKSGYTAATISGSVAAGVKVYGTPVITTFSYPSTNISRAGGTATPTLSYSLPWTWNGVLNSGGTITSGANVSFNLDNTDGFSINSSSGVVTAASNQNASNIIAALPKLAKETEVEVEVEFDESGDILYEYAVVKQDGDLIKSYSISPATGGTLGTVDKFTKYAGSNTITNSSSSSATPMTGTYVLDSGAFGGDGTNNLSNYFNVNGPTYSWSSNGSWATVSGNAATTTVNVTANTGAARSATITRTASYDVSLKPEYKSSSLLGTDPRTITATATTTVSQAAGVINQERAVFYGSYPSSLQVLGVSGGLAFQTGSNTSFSSSSYTIPGINNDNEYTGITLTETDSTKASSFYIYLNNVQIAIPYQVAPRLHLRVGVKSSNTLFTETWYDQYITADSVVYQDGAYVATWGTSNYALVNIPASNAGSHCHIDVQFTT